MSIAPALVLGLSLLAVSTTQPADSQTVRLPAWNPPDNPVAAAFRLDAAASVNVWGRGAEAARAYFDELLPALFDRTLVIEQFDPADGSLEWVFTGKRTGFTLQISGSEVRLLERFYDSYGFTPFEQGKVKPTRHPERIWRESRATYHGQLTGVTVTLDHKLGLTVALNGMAVFQRDFLFDISRHQLRVTGQQCRISGRLLVPPVREVTVCADPEARHQTMIGWGGITTPTAYAQLSEDGRRRWWGMVCTCNLLIQREYPNGQRLNEQMDNWDRHDSATPHYYGDNFPNGEISDFSYIRMLRRLGGKVFFEFWALPAWARHDWTDAAGKVHPGVADPEVYARAMVRYCQVSQDKAGAPPDVVGIQNEIHQPTEIWHEMTRTLRRELDRAGFDRVAIHMSDAATLAGGIQRARAFRAAPDVWDAIDYAATHMYDYQARFTDPDAFDTLLGEWKDLVSGKPFLSTELCVNSPAYQADSYRLALLMGQLYHKNLVITDASAVCYCWTLLNVVQPSYGATRSLCVPDASNGFMPAPSSHQLRVFAAYSRRIHAGMRRIDVTCNDPDLLASGFVGSDAKLKTVVLLNRSTAPLAVQVAWPGGLFETVERAGPYHPNAVQMILGAAGDGSIRVDIEPGQIATVTSVPLRRLPENLTLIH